MRRRWLTPERLEPRVLLAAPEGGEFRLPRQTVDPVGLAGTISATIRWGDGTETAVPVSTPTVPGKIRLRFDYSLDTSNFFTAERRTALEQAGRSVSQYLTDELSAISPGGDNSWTAAPCHPSQGSGSQCVTTQIPNLSVAANELVIFAGARDFDGIVRGTGGFGGFSSARGSQQFLDAVIGRGQAGTKSNPQTDVGPWGGSISFDSRGTDWYFGSNSDGITANQIDFRTVAAHELLHVLGFGLIRTDTTTAWQNLTRGTTFNGERAKNAYIGSGFPPLETENSSIGPIKLHWADSIEELGQPTLMSAAVPTGAPVDDSFGPGRGG